MSQLEHAPSNPDLVYTLDEHRDRIFEILNRSAIEIGVELIQAKRNHPGRFMKWVEDEMPWGIDKAEKVMALARAFATAPPAFMDSLPQAWTALYDLSRVPVAVLHRAIDEGTVTPDSTVDECRRFVAEHNKATMSPPPEPVVIPTRFDEPERPKVSASVLVTELVSGYSPDEITESLRERLRLWASGDRIPTSAT